MSKEMNFLNTTSVESSSNKHKGSSQASKTEAKSAPSLFDSMLSGASNSKEETATSKTEASTLGKEQKASGNASDMSEKNSKHAQGQIAASASSSATAEKSVSSEQTHEKQSKTLTENPIQNQKDNNSTHTEKNANENGDKKASLLDKLLNEANERLKQSNQEGEKKSTTSSSTLVSNAASSSENDAGQTPLRDNKAVAKSGLALQQETKQTSTLENTIEKNKTAKVNSETTEETNSKVEKKDVASSSLFDRLTQNSSKDVQENSQQDKTEKSVVQQQDNKQANGVEVKNTTQQPNSLFEQLTQEVAKDLEGSLAQKNEKGVETPKQTVDAKTLQSVTENKIETTVAKTTQEAANPTAQTASKAVEQQTTTTVLNSSASAQQSSLNDQTAQNENGQDTKRTNSLLDRLLEQTKTTLSKEGTIATNSVQNSGIEMGSKNMQDPILTNIYLSSLNKTVQDSILEKSFHAKSILGQASSVADVQKGADLLNLNMQDSEVITKQEEFKSLVKNEFLHKIAVSKENIHFNMMQKNEDILNTTQQIKSALSSAQAVSAQASNTINIAQEMELNVPATLAFNIENRIIGARQQMNSMMSDVARNMYLNYKPPVTAFRMNLNPANLGNIAVLIKSDKQNGLSISLNMSNIATLDSFVENQTALRAALAKNFEATTNINLEFNMQGEQQDSHAKEQDRPPQRQAQNHSTSDLMESLSKKNEQEINAINYM